MQREELFRPWESYYQQIIDWAKKANQPFFLWSLLLDTHWPFLSPREYRKWSSFWDMWLYNWKIQRGNFNPNFSERERQKAINAYDNSILYADSFINKLWEDTKEKNPIFIIHSDHGESFGEHGFYGHKSYLYEEIVHVPLVIYNAGLKGKKKSPVSLLGLSSSIYKLLKIENAFPSKDFLSHRNDWVISKITEKDRNKVAVRMRDWKFITGHKDVDELYNVAKDLGEKNNLIDKHPKLAREMKEIARNFQRIRYKRKT